MNHFNLVLQRDAWIKSFSYALQASRDHCMLYEQETLNTRLLMREHICVEGASFKERLFDWGRRRPKLVRILHYKDVGHFCLVKKQN